MTKPCCLALVMLAACDVEPDPASVQLGDVESEDVLPKATLGLAQAPAERALPSTPSAPTITYHGGPVMTAPTNVYLIWYGAWSGNTATTILPAFASHIGGSPYFNINTTYTNAAGAKVANVVRLAGQTTDAYSRGKTLADLDVAMVVTKAIAAKKLPLDQNGFYAVLTSADVAESSGFCSAYCGWHTYAIYNSANLKISFIGNADRCISACAAQTKGPNGNAGADAMVSVFAHELSEAVTDPNLNAWYDATGAENADKCAWTFGTTYATANGARANLSLAGKDYFVQRNWMNSGAGSCVLSH